MKSAEIAGTLNGLPFDKRLEVERLMKRIGDSADDGTAHVLAVYARGLSLGAIARVSESVARAGVRNRAGYAVRGMRSELEALA